MSELGYVSQKIGGVIDKFLCENFHKNERQLPPGKYVSLCFDDFPQSAARNAAPMIEAHGWRATWYVAGGFLDQTEPYYGTMFTEEDLNQLRQNGHDFGCHTFDHIDCRDAEDAEIHAQCQRSREFLNARGIDTIRSFAFPFGAADVPAKKTMLQSGMALRGVKPGTNRGKVDLGMLRACGLQDNESGTHRAFEELEQLSDEDGWLIIFTHDVRDTPSPWGVTPEEYAEILDEIAKMGATVLPVGDMIDLLEPASAIEA